jgi:hypothetical protein
VPLSSRLQPSEHCITTRIARAYVRYPTFAYNRGDITVLDRGGLEKASCACYGADQQTYDRVLGY